MLLKHLRQAFQHNPEQGEYGDCMRTSIAMILGLERDSVPNFGVHYGNQEAWNNAVDDWCQSQGLFIVDVPVQGGTAEDAIKMFLNWTHNRPFMMSGQSIMGTNHSVAVNCNGIIFDPQARTPAFVGPCDDGYWWFSILAKLPEGYTHGA